MTTTARWWFALKPMSWPKLLVPTLLGQSLGRASAPALDWRGLAVGLAFTMGLLGCIVLLNDWGDRRVDAIKRRMFPDGCSPKTIPDGVLSARHVLLGGLLGCAVALAVAALGQRWPGRPLLLLCAIGALSVFFAYTFAPLRLNYRGGGELLEALGVGAVLPWLQAYLQGGLPWHASYTLLAGFILLSLASALASGLSDEQSDRAGGKRTITTMLGNRATRRGAEACVALGATAWLVVGLAIPAVRWWSVLPPTALVLYHGLQLRAASDRARTNAFAAQGLYKRLLHRAIWRGVTALALLLALGAG